jgi:hypothetical protein
MVLIDALKWEIDQLPERYIGYHKALLDTLVDVVALERENAMVRINIVQKVRDKTESLAKLVETKASEA